MPRKAEDTVANLVRDLVEPSDRFDFVRHATRFFEFAALLRYPNQPKPRAYAAKVLLARYISDYFDDLGPEQRVDQLSLLLKHANPKTLIPDLLSDSGFDFAMEFEKTDDQDLVASIVRFLISYAPDDGDIRNRASLKKAFYLFERRALYDQEPRTWKAFNEAWAKFKSVSPFLFVRRYSLRHFTFVPNPQDQNYLTTIGRALDDQNLLRKYFAQAKWAGRRLEETLDPRALKELTLPAFPDELPELSVTLSPISAKMRDLLGEYRRP